VGNNGNGTIEKTKSSEKSCRNRRNLDEGWDDYFYKMAKLVGSRSRDDSQVGTVVVGHDHIVLSTAYNGLPRRVGDHPQRLTKAEKLKWIVHAEANAICNAAQIGVPLNGATVYVTKFPCSRCAGELVQIGVRRLVCRGKTMWKRDPSKDDGRRALRILMEAGVAIDAPNLPIGQLDRRTRQNGVAKRIVRRARQ
jgi:dCMP deaminase